MLIYPPCLVLDMAITINTEQRIANRSPKGVYKGTREEWLEDAAQIMGTWLNEHITVKDIKEHNANRVYEKHTLRRFKLSNCAFRCGITSARKDYRMTHTTVGQIHYDFSTDNGKNEIVISNRLNGSKTKAESSYVGHILLHEMIHSCTVHHGHKGQFKRLALLVGMTGKMTSTESGEDLDARIIKEVVNPLGKFPHKAVTNVTERKGSRMKKIVCTRCDLIMRGSRTVVGKVEGANCPCCGVGFLEEGVLTCRLKI